jgi:hypothetical protein
MFTELLLNIVSILHIMFVLFVLIVPFTSSNYLLFIHSIFIPFLLFHWILNDNTCALTIIERKLRQTISGKEFVDDECITCKLIEPVYDFRKNYETFTLIIYTITISLWLISVYKLYSGYKNGNIKSFKDLLII